MCPVFYVGTDVQTPPAPLTLAPITLGRDTSMEPIFQRCVQTTCVSSYVSIYLFISFSLYLSVILV